MQLARFAIPHLLILFCGLALLAGTWWPWIFFLVLSVAVTVGDAFLGDDVVVLASADERYAHALLFAALPLLIWLISIVLIVTSPHLQERLIAPDTILNSYVERWNFSWIQSLGITLSLGLLIGGIGTSVAHECTHRRHDHWLASIGNWLLALSMDSVFPIEHNHGHHKHVGTVLDPATARRGENVFRFIARSIVGEYRNALCIETTRLRRVGTPFFSRHNRYLIALARSLVILLASAIIGSAKAACVLLAAMIWAKILLETVNYIQHYGLVRLPGSPIEPRHSWNSNAWMSGTITFFLTRHSHHHQKGSLSFWRLEPIPQAPTLPWGYLSAIYLALLSPRRYRLLMEPALEDWYARYASPEEQRVGRSDSPSEQYATV